MSGLSQLGPVSIQLLLNFIQSFPLGLEDLVVLEEGSLHQAGNSSAVSNKCFLSILSAFLAAQLMAFAERKAAIAPEKPWRFWQLQTKTMLAQSFTNLRECALQQKPGLFRILQLFCSILHCETKHTLEG
jgi:hypothetical protein